jgi:hypothetical protein
VSGSLRFTERTEFVAESSSPEEASPKNRGTRGDRPPEEGVDVTEGTREKLRSVSFPPPSAGGGLRLPDDLCKLLVYEALSC